MKERLIKLVSNLGFKEVFSLSFVALFFLLVSTASATSPVNGHSIVIDAGHGGDDSGSTACTGYPEKDANLDIAFILEQKLIDSGATVHMTRTGYDETLSNRDRYERANSTDGEVLVSIHLNGSSDPSVDGTLGLYGKRNKDMEFTKVMHSGMSEDLSVDGFNVPDLGITNFASGVLLKSDMPATIQETVFISNTDECIALRDGDGEREKDIAQALFNGLESWFNQTSDGGSDDDGNGGGNGNGNGRDCTEPPCNNK